MPISITSSVVGMLQLIAPVLACAWALRTHKSRLQVVLISAGGGFVSGLLSAVPATQMAAALGDGPDRVVYFMFNVALSAAIFGAIVGIAGISFRPGRTTGRRRA